MNRIPEARKKPLHWVSSSYRDLLDCPAVVRSELGRGLTSAQYGGKHKSAKPWKGSGPGVLELVANHDTNTYRAVYSVRLEQAIYVLHVFQKKSPSGIKTALRDVQLINSRLKLAQVDYEKIYGNQNR